MSDPSSEYVLVPSPEAAALVQEQAEKVELVEVTRETFGKTELSRLSQLCGYTEEGYEALLDAVAADLLAAGYRKGDALPVTEVAQ